MAQASKKGKLPKSAVRSLMEYCEKLASESNDSAAEIFRRHLELMKKYGDYFFSDLWPQKPDDRLGLSEEQAEFIEEAKDYVEKCERFQVVCLKRSIGLEGFDPEHFTSEFNWLGRQACWDCLVPEAMELRKQIAADEQRRKENEEAINSGEPSWMTKRMHEFYNLPDVVRSDRMRLVKLRFCDEVGLTAGKNCEVRHRYECPHGEGSEQLVKSGGLGRIAWRLVEWYDSRWNRTHTVSPAACEMKWYHYDEPSVIDVTSYEDVMKATEDGRLLKILEEFKMYEKETGNRY